jgi:hypothetical protein
MEFIMDVLFTTGWGAVIVGFCILVAIIIKIFDDKPKI